ncbi:MAG: CRTAC1 family protein [Acidobacteriota bacterium]
MTRASHRLARAARTCALLGAAALVAATAVVHADGGVTFRDIAAGDEAGITYRRAPSASNAEFDAIKNDPPYDETKRLATPMKARGAPGVAVLDYDGDGDLDLYVTNGPGASNALYSSRLREDGALTFVDVAQLAGVAAVDHDSTGVCYADIDNDGDADLLVLSHNATHRLFENRGDGTFADISMAAGLTAQPVRSAASCSFGDVDNDGLLDVAIANTFDTWDNFDGIFPDDPFDRNQHNVLLRNAGDNRFVDISATSGIEVHAGFPDGRENDAGLTWAIALVDYDLDGDVDLFTADDQGGIPLAVNGGLDRGLLHVFENDGTGRFVDRAAELGTNRAGSWMGLSFGDYNCDERLDFFGTNFGDYQPAGTPIPGDQPSRWLLARSDGSFNDPGVGTLQTTPFGWGTSTVDYDNDADLDIVYHGGHDVGPGIDLSNSGVILQNQGCSASFTPDFDALAGSTDHVRRVVHGMAAGDLDEDGFVDIVSVSNLNVPEAIALSPYTPLDSPFDAVARFISTFDLDPVSEQPAWNGNVYDNGTLSVEINSGGNGNGSIAIDVVGSIGLTGRAGVNRDGVGAVVRVWPIRGESSTLPALGGASYASQDSPWLHFGLGTETRAIVDVLWPGGVRNRLYNVNAGERIVFPEIPCSYDDDSVTFRSYLQCVVNSLSDLVEAGVLTEYQRTRFLMSAMRAQRGDRGLACTIAGVMEFEFAEEF